MCVSTPVSNLIIRLPVPSSGRNFPLAMREPHNRLRSVSEPSFKRNCTGNPTQLYTQGDTSFVYVAHICERTGKNEYTHLYALPCMYTMKCSITAPAGSYMFLTKLSIYGNSSVRFQVGDSASTKVCHQPHDTFRGWYVSTGTLQGTFLSIESPRPSWPYLFHPQQNTSPSSVIIALWRAPQETDLAFLFSRLVASTNFGTVSA